MNGTVKSMEIKKGASPNNADKHFYILENLGFKIEQGTIYSLILKEEPYSRYARLKPISSLL